MKRVVGLSLILLPLVLSGAASAKPGDRVRPALPIKSIFPMGPSLTPPVVHPDRRPPELTTPNVAPTRQGLPLPFVGRGNMAIGAWSPSKSTVVGVGLYRVPKVQRLDRGRSPSASDTQTHNVPAVGLSLSF